MRWRGGLLILFCAPASACGLQPLDTGAASGVADLPKRDPTAGPTTAIEDPAIALDPADESTTTTEPCVKTAGDAHHILGVYCGGCHDRGPASSGAPRFDFLMEDQRLMSAGWTVGAEQRKFVIAGDPDHSWLYLRPLLGTMPPVQTDLRNADYPRPTISDLSVLREWITHCIDPSHAPAPIAAPEPGTMPPPGPSPAADNAQFNFESGTQGWIAHSTEQGDAPNVATSTAPIFAGASSLSGLITSIAPSSYSMEISNPPSIPAGAMITYHAFIPTDAPIGGVQPWVIDAAGTVTGSYLITPATGSWISLTVVAPAAGANAITRLGVTFFTQGTWTGRIYVDSIGW